MYILSMSDPAICIKYIFDIYFKILGAGTDSVWEWPARFKEHRTH